MRFGSTQVMDYLKQVLATVNVSPNNALVTMSSALVHSRYIGRCNTICVFVPRPVWEDLKDIRFDGVQFFPNFADYRREQLIGREGPYCAGPVDATVDALSMLAAGYIELSQDEAKDLSAMVKNEGFREFIEIKLKRFGTEFFDSAIATLNKLTETKT